MTRKFDISALPIQSEREAVLSCRAQYVILQAETGSGKTICVPQWFSETGRRVLVTEPLVEAAKGAARFVSELTGTKLGELAGYAAGRERQFNASTRIVFCTVALAAIRELSSHNEFDVWILDELHEWNVHQSVLEAYAWASIQRGACAFEKVVAMSAMMDVAALASARGNAPVFTIPGRGFEIEDRPPGASIEADIRQLVADEHDVLVFQPGEAEIKNTIGAIKDVDAELIPFYKECSPQDKARAYASYSRPRVVVATNSLETGLTLEPSPHRTLAVVDSGLERRNGVRDNVEGLILAPIPLSNRLQRRGRTGRTGTGIYIDHCPVPPYRRARYGQPELYRARLDRVILQLTAFDHDAATFPFFHALDGRAVARAKYDLRRLGLLDDHGDITERGRLATRLSRLALEDSAILLRAIDYGVAEDAMLLVVLRGLGFYRPATPGWVPAQSRSDLLANLEWYRWYKTTVRHGGTPAAALDIAPDVRDLVQKVDEEHRLLESELRHLQVDTKRHTGAPDDLRKAIVAGMLNHVYKWDVEKQAYVDLVSKFTCEGRAKTVVAAGTEWVVAVPFRTEDRTTGADWPRLQDITAIEPEWLPELAPHLVDHAYTDIRYDLATEELVCDIAARLDEVPCRQTSFRAAGPEAIALLKARIRGSSALPGAVGAALADKLVDKLEDALAGAAAELKRWDSLRGQDWCVECVFTASPTRGAGWGAAEGCFSGQIESRLDPKRFPVYTNEPVIFATELKCSWLAEEVLIGVYWICKVSRQDGVVEGRPEILVKPLVRADKVNARRLQINRMKEMLASATGSPGSVTSQRKS